MSLSTRSCPKRNGQSGNYCAFCNYWEGDANLKSRNTSIVEFDDKIKGIWLKTKVTLMSSHLVC